MKNKPIETLQAELEEVRNSSWDGKSRLVSNSDNMQADNHVWGIVSDHGNVELCHKGRNGHIYYHGGVV